MSESARLADEIRRAFDGEAWHGDSLMEILAGVNAKTAAAKPVPTRIVSGSCCCVVAAWDGAAIRPSPGPRRATRVMPKLPPIEDTERCRMA